MDARTRPVKETRYQRENVVMDQWRRLKSPMVTDDHARDVVDDMDMIMGMIGQAVVNLFKENGSITVESTLAEGVCRDEKRGTGMQNDQQETVRKIKHSKICNKSRRNTKRR